MHFGAVEGTVSLTDGTPVAGAHVRLWDNRHSEPLETITDEMGAFAFAEVMVGWYESEARLEGYPDAEDWIFVAAEQTTTVNLVLGGSLDEVGSVAGLVTTEAGAVVAGARVRLDGGRDPMHGHGIHLQTTTNDAGVFTFENVPVGGYMVSAMLRMHGFAAAPIEVAANQVTNVTLVLHRGHHHPGDSLTIVELAGIAIVVEADSNHHHARYFIDIDADGAADYRLAFGPPWYEPNSGAHRPINGDEITIVGGLFTYTEPSVVVVFQINGLFWRDPRHGHGGHGGGDHHGCNPDSVMRVEMEGIAMVRAGGMHGGDVVHYGINTDDDEAAEFILDFGRSDYDPGNGAQRPEAGDEITIVGGQIYCPNAPILIVIVYEINGMFWREPGDTLGFGAETPEAANEPVYLGSPTTYLTAKNFPNPFNPTTTISYSIPTTGDVKVSVFDVTGREVAELVNTYQNAGSYAVQWNGSHLASGIYFYRVNVGSLSFTNRMILMK
jgi:hypothetical protein